MRKNNNLIQVNEITEQTKASLRTRIISAVVALVISLPCVLFGDFLIALYIAVCLVISIFEIIHSTKQKHNPVLYIFCFVIGFLLTFYPMIISDWSHFYFYNGFSTIIISVTVLMVAIFLLFFSVVLDKNFTVTDSCYIITLIIIVSIGFQSLLFLRYFPSYRYHIIEGVKHDQYFNYFDNIDFSSLLFYLAIASFMADAGAYFVGVFFGKHKINERISQHKTWEGFFGGILVSIIFSSGFAFILAACGRPVGGIFTFDNWYHILIISGVLPFISTLGDFVFSSFKRSCGIKDYGNVMPGHGGILDRFDATLFAAIALAIYVATFFGQNAGGLVLP